MPKLCMKALCALCLVGCDALAGFQGVRLFTPDAARDATMDRSQDRTLTDRGLSRDVGGPDLPTDLRSPVMDSSACGAKCDFTSGQPCGAIGQNSGWILQNNSWTPNPLAVGIPAFSVPGSCSASMHLNAVLALAGDGTRPCELWIELVDGTSVTDRIRLTVFTAATIEVFAKNGQTTQTSLPTPPVFGATVAVRRTASTLEVAWDKTVTPAATPHQTPPTSLRISTSGCLKVAFALLSVAE